MLLLLLACNTDVQVAKQDDTGPALSTQERLGLTDGEVRAILAFLNDCATDLGLLDGDVGLDSDAAEALVTHRDGPDGRCGGEDDAPFGTLDEVDAVPQVGDQSILAIHAWLEGGRPVDDDTWEGVSLTAEEQRVVLEIANEATYAQLDDDVGLASDEATNIVDARPIEDMDALAAVPQVGASAIEKLVDYVPSWR